ncbi:MAG: hypothetical protein L6408_05795 [Nanoarchaeota archaeon]|nr:hypothetical protein [Nanoarchaeota archaeon]
MILWFLPVILALGILTSYTDIKHGKVKNKHLFFALLYGIIAYTIIIFINLGYVRIDYFTELTINCTFALVVGFIIWYVGLWTAGDAKLFFTYSFLIPLSTYRYGYVPYFSSTNILINTLIPMFLFLLAVLLFKTSLRQKAYFFKNAFKPKRVLQLVIFLFAFGWIITLLFCLFKIPPDYFLMILILFIFMTLLEKVVSINIFKIVIVISILRFALDRSIYSIEFLYWFLFMVLMFVILRFFVISMGFHIFTKEVDIALLQKGMIPAEGVYKEKDRYKKQAFRFYTLLNYLSEKTKKRDYLFESTSEGLTEKDVKKLKNLEKKLGFEHLRVQQTIPFAPYMFLGVLLTIIFQGNAFLALVFLF